jgi:Flp pilus assembly protein TadG
VITGWLVKIVIVIAALGFLGVEVGSPVIVRAQVDGAAHDAADDAAGDYFQHHNEDTAKALAQQDASDKSATLESFDVKPETGLVTVTLTKQARSFVLKKIKRFKSWYQVRVTVTSAGRGK